jgi:myo-inositol 2-dehydrogenase/D-chiro-inositol 1-dehydrogenase
MRLNVDLFHDAYTAELSCFVEAVKARRDGVQATCTTGPGGTDARNALAVALAAFRSAETGLPVDVSAIAELRAAEPEFHPAGLGA